MSLPFVLKGECQPVQLRDDDQPAERARGQIQRTRPAEHQAQIQSKGREGGRERKKLGGRAREGGGGGERGRGLKQEVEGEREG